MKPSNKIRRREAREQRRLEYGAARAAFLLAGGHKDYIVPFHMNWRYEFAIMTASLEKGHPTYTNPRNPQHGYYSNFLPSDPSKPYIYTQTINRK